MTSEIEQALATVGHVIDGDADMAWRYRDEAHAALATLAAALGELDTTTGVSDELEVIGRSLGQARANCVVQSDATLATAALNRLRLRLHQPTPSDIEIETAAESAWFALFGDRHINKSRLEWRWFLDGFRARRLCQHCGAIHPVTASFALSRWSISRT